MYIITDIIQIVHKDAFSQSYRYFVTVDRIEGQKWRQPWTGVRFPTGDLEHLLGLFVDIRDLTGLSSF